MLRLRKVEILGFKSFCEKTTVTFSGEGLTAIVGPNGCGKSNVVDAISWVLGEQSHKSLRAERMADCIFNGTAKRPPMGLAEVKITLVDPELAAAAEFVLNGNGKEVKEVEEVMEVKEQTSHPDDSASDATADPAKAENQSQDINAERAEVPEVTESEVAQSKRRRKQAAPVMQSKPGEVVVGRRLYRSGQSEYVVNGRVARLRDIQELFMGTGLGPESYAIIEQGRIGQILSSKPTERRAIIEEAAGVSKYKTKKRLAEAKLESSKLNLARVNDILVEVEKQVASLKRQASKARRYAEIREQMRGMIRTVLASKARELDSDAERIAAALRETNQAETAQAQSLHALETEQERLAQRSYELETELRRNQNLLGECALELDRAENRVGFNRERSRELELRLAQLTGELAQLAEQAGVLDRQAQSHASGVAALREEKASLEAWLAELTAASTAKAAEEIDAEARITELRQAAGRLADDLTRLHGEQAQAEGAISHLSEARGRSEQIERKLLEENAQHQESARSTQAQFEAAEAEARTLAETVRAAQARIADLRRRKQETTERYDQLREQMAGVRARRGSLEQILNDRSYTADAVQKLFAADGEGQARGFRAVGVLADYAEVEERHEAAVEQFLREELEYVVVETFDHARAGIAMLREEVGGRATFFVDSLRKLNIEPGDAPMPFTASQGVVSRLDNLVSFKDPLGPAAKQFLPKLRSAFLVETAEAAEQLAHENKQYCFVTTDGTCYQGRLVSGGRPGDAGPLAMKRELRQLEAEATKLERAVEEAHAGVLWLEDELRNCEQSLEQSLAAQVEAEKALVAATHQRDAAQVELNRVAQQLRDAQMELARLDVETKSAQLRAELTRQRHEETAASRTSAEMEVTDLTARVAVLRGELQAHQEELAARRSDAAALGERLASAETIHERRLTELNELRERESGLRGQQEQLTRERAELEEHSQALQVQIATLTAEKARLAARKAELELEWEAARTRTVQVDDALRLARQSLGDLREQRAQKEIDRARNESDRNHLRETCLAELNAHPEELIAQETAFLTGEELAAAETNYREMRARIESMGPVNMMALEEFKEAEQRFIFLTRERDDLVKSIEDTLATIKELDEVSRKKFAEAFEVINRHFSQAFVTLFGGGSAEMRFGEPDSSGEQGIDIIAQPPGKRLQNVMLLSGGEKALTAVSLLIAIFRYTPSPFCILDEVDAPLDETNVGRFNRMLADMSAQTQFIIITHNRRTMEMAPVLYGVTMQEPGVSKLVSVRWDEAQPAAPTAA
ncbi:MAG: chromosome segregation protein SMC [Candidatus Acidiferrales bacterium]